MQNTRFIRNVTFAILAACSATTQAAEEGTMIFQCSKISEFAVLGKTENGFHFTINSLHRQYGIKIQENLNAAGIVVPGQVTGIEADFNDDQCIPNFEGGVEKSTISCHLNYLGEAPVATLRIRGAKPDGSLYDQSIAVGRTTISTAIQDQYTNSGRYTSTILRFNIYDKTNSVAIFQDNISFGRGCTLGQ